MRTNASKRLMPAKRLGRSDVRLRTARFALPFHQRSQRHKIAVLATLSTSDRWQSSMRSFMSANAETSTKNPGEKPAISTVSANHNFGGESIAALSVTCPREAQNHVAASATAEAAR